MCQHPLFPVFLRSVGFANVQGRAGRFDPGGFFYLRNWSLGLIQILGQFDQLVIPSEHLLDRSNYMLRRVYRVSQIYYFYLPEK